MKQTSSIQLLSLFSFALLLSLSIPLSSVAQVKYHSEDLSLSIKGTSSMHDWEMKSEKGLVEAVFILGTNNKLSSVSGLHFSVASTSLKSGHNAMDKNTYKALKTNAFQNISFILSSANINQINGTSYQLRFLGNLTIAGTTRETELIADCTLNADKSFTCSGAKKLKMTDFNVTPPVALMGAIKTGDDISVGYNMKISK